MEGTFVMEEISKSLPVATNTYSGELLDNLRSGRGQEHWKTEDYETYEGQFLHDSLHGVGTYSWGNFEKNSVYEGLLYANDIEGYGKISFKDCSVFEGLFRRNCRFGPGVLTEACGKQNVGMWMGNDLVRLCCVVLPEWVARIAKSPMAKVQILKFKRLVCVCDPASDKAKDILRQLDADDELLKQSHKLYNKEVRNRNSRFFNSSLHDEKYFSEQDCYIEVEVVPEEVQTQTSSESNISQPACEFDLSGLVEVVVDENPKQIRIHKIKQELQEVEEEIKGTRREISGIKLPLKYLQMTSMLDSREDQRKSVNWEKEIPISNSNHFNSEATISESDDSKKEKEEESETDAAGEEIYKSYLAAKDIEKKLTLRKKDLLNKLTFENDQPDEMQVVNRYPTKKVLVTHFLAWNNEELSVEMLRYAFLHRNLENNVSFCVASLLASNRYFFKSAGAYESACISFLKACSFGSIEEAIHWLRLYNINPDICDANGNTGMIFAAARDRIRIMTQLVNLGANVDILNDESFTPLGMCIVRYLAVQYSVTNWEKAFLKATILPSEEQQEVQNWRPHVSLASINNEHDKKSSENINLNLQIQYFSSLFKIDNSQLFRSSLEFIQNLPESLTGIEAKLTKTVECVDLQESYVQSASDVPQPYILNTDCIKPPPEPKKNENDKKGKKDKKDKKAKEEKSKSKLDTSSKKSKKGAESSTDLEASSPETTENLISPEEMMRVNKLSAIYETITTLLKYGANPNACEMPMPLLTLSIFIKNIDLVTVLLNANANPNLTTIDENLTPLHVIVALPICSELVTILELLLRYGANPNMKTNNHHWIEEKQVLLAQRKPDEESEGKTPLHILCMRYDFVFDVNHLSSQMIDILIKNGASTREKYFGHTPLTLAMLRGNTELVKTLFGTGKVSAKQKLGEKMGVPLTLYILKRYRNIIPNFETCVEIIKLLIAHKANIFDDVEGLGNVLEFMVKEHEEPEKDKGKGKKGKDKKDQGGQKGKKGKPVVLDQDRLKPFLLNLGKTNLERHLKGYALTYLYNFVKEEDFYDDLTENAAKFLTAQEVVEIAQALIHAGEIPVEEDSYRTLYDLIELIVNVNSSKIACNDPAYAINIDEMLENFEFKSLDKKQIKRMPPDPAVDKHDDRYNVCYNCLKKIGELLFICPNCRLVYYCSEECNKLSNKEKKQLHNCGLVYYNKRKVIYEERLERAAHWQRGTDARETYARMAKEKGYAQFSDDDITKMKRHIVPDEKRRLHLKYLAELNKKPMPNMDRFNKSMVMQREEHQRGSLLSLRWQLEGSKFLNWKPKGTPDTQRTKLKELQYKLGKEQANHIRSGAGQGNDWLIDDLHIKTDGSFISKSIKPEIRDMVAYGEVKRKLKDDENSLKGGGKLCDLRVRLPSKYQYFLEKLSELWPDFDFENIFLPFACYCDGQLYYRFLKNRPVFIATCSSL